MKTIEQLSRFLERRDFINTLTRPFRRFGHWLVKSAQYAWFLRDDIDWDYSSILELLQYKLKRTRVCLENDGWLGYKDKRLISRDIRTCELLLQRLMDDNYSEVHFDKLEAKWEQIKCFPDSPKRKLTPTEKAQYSKEMLAMADYEDQMIKQDIELFCKIFSRKYRSWWS